MTNIINGYVLEDKYLDYLAGFSGGKDIISEDEKRMADNAKRCKISNIFSSIVNGLTDGLFLMTVGVLIWPVIDDNMRPRIFGSYGICVPCGVYVRYFKEAKNSLFPVQNETTLQYLWNTAMPYVEGVGATVQCALDTEAETLDICRPINYIGSIKDIVVNNFLILGGIAFAIGFYAIYQNMRDNCENSKQEEWFLTHTLEQRFKNIAARLESLQTTKEVQKYSAKILKHLPEISKEIKLKLPYLTLKKITEMTKPVYNAATKKQQSNPSQIPLAVRKE